MVLADTGEISITADSPSVRNKSQSLNGYYLSRAMLTGVSNLERVSSMLPGRAKLGSSISPELIELLMKTK